MAFATRSNPTIESGAVDDTEQRPASYLDRNRRAWDELAPTHLATGRKAWAETDLRWGIWGIPESSIGLVRGIQAGDDVIELGCGTASVSAWLARQGARSVAVDLSPRQIQNVEQLQREFDLRFPAICANAEEIRYDDTSFDIAVSDYGASLWCDPEHWLAEAHRLLRPNGILIFFTSGAQLMMCTPDDGGPASDRLVRDYFGPTRVEFDSRGPVEFHPTHGDWVRLLVATGFTIEDLLEIQPPAGSLARFPHASLEWARRWPSEEVWIARKASQALTTRRLADVPAIVGLGR